MTEYTFDDSDLEAIRAMAREDRTQRARAAAVTATASPDEMARAMRYERERGVPALAAAQNLPEHDRLAQLDAVGDASERDARLGGWLGDPKRAALAQDDLGPLSKLSAAMAAGRVGGGAVDRNTREFRRRFAESWNGGSAAGVSRTWGEAANDAVTAFNQAGRSAVLGLAESPWTATNAIESAWGRSQQALAEMYGLRAPATSLTERPAFIERMDRNRRAIGAGEDARLSDKARLARTERPDDFAGALAYGLSNPSIGLTSDVPGSVGAMVAGGFVPGRVQATIAAQAWSQAAMAAGDARETVARRGGSEQEAQQAAATTFPLALGVGLVATKLVPGGAAVESVMAGGGRIATRRVTAGAVGVAGEAVSEGLEEGGVRASQNVGTGDPLMTGVGGAAAGGVLLGGPMGALSALAPEGSNTDRILERVERLGRSAIDNERLHEATAAAAESKTVERAPAEVEALVGDDARVYVPVDAARALFQSGDVSFEAWVEQVTGDPEQVALAGESGDLAIPAGKWATIVSRLPNRDEWVRNARLDPEGYSPADIEQADFIERLVADVPASTAEAPAAAQAIEDDVYAQLLNTGRMSDNEARTNAQLAGRLAVMVERMGGDPSTVYAQMGLQVTDGTEPATGGLLSQLGDKAKALFQSFRGTPQGDPTAEAFRLLAEDSEAFRLPRSDSASLAEIVEQQEGAEGIKLVPEHEMGGNLVDGSDADKAWALRSARREFGIIFENKDHVWIDVYDFKQGGGGQRVYNIAATYAHNTGRTLIGDPAGLSDVAQDRRLENMLSSALKFGTTRHIRPHPKQLTDNVRANAPGLDWRDGDDAFNIQQMLGASLASLEAQFPEIKDYRYDPATDEIRSVSGKAVLTSGQAKELADRAREAARGARDRGIAAPAITGGGRSIERTILAGSLLRGTREEQSAILARLGGQRSARLKGILYQSDPAASGVSAARGQLRIGENGRLSIDLLSKADASTFVHELAHVFFETMGTLAGSPNASERGLADFDALLRWGSIEGDTPEARRATWAGMDLDARRQLHEGVAEGFEKYLQEGKAPSPSLSRVFASLRAWITAAYRVLRNERIPLTDEVREVFDRMLASDEEIDAARAQQHYEPVVDEATAQARGIPLERYTAVRAQLEAARDDALARLTAQNLKAYQRETKAWWKAELGKVRDEVAAELEAIPAIQAWRTMAKKDGPKLSSDAVKEMLGGTLPASIRRLAIWSREGSHPDAVALSLGFSSGSELVAALQGVKALEVRVDQVARERMRERHGDPMMDGTLSDKAMRAAHSTKQVRALEAELGMLEGMAASTTAIPGQADTAVVTSGPAARAFRLVAERRVDSLALRDLRPNDHLIAERRAAVNAQRLASEGDFVRATAAKREQLLHASLYRVTRDAIAEVERGVRYARRLEKKPARQRLGKGGVLEMVDGILGTYSFRDASDKARERAARLRDWYMRQQAAGVDVQVAPQVMAQIESAERIHYRDMPIAEFRGVIELVKQLEHQAREANTLRLAGEEADLEVAANGLSEAVRGSLKARGAPPISSALQQKLGERAKRGARTAAAWLLRLRAVANWVDGAGNVTGPAHQYIIRPLDRAQAEYLDLVKQYGQRVVDLFETHLKGVDLHEPVWMPTLGQNLTRSDIIAIALNMGNASNVQRVRDGMGWGDVQLTDILQHLTRSDTEFVQSVWDTLESLWPRIAEQQKRMTGVTPPKIDRKPVTLRVADGTTVTLPGGYFPIVYDRESTQWRAFVNADADTMFEPMAMMSLPANGFTKQRVDQAGIPLKFDLAIIPRHLGMVLKDVTHRETLLAIQKLVRTPQVASALTETLGPEAGVMIEDKLRTIATDQLVQGGRLYGALSKVSRMVRRHVGIMAMGLSVVSAIKQIIGVTAAGEVMLERHGKSAPGLMLSGYKRMLEPGALDAMRTMSGEMRHRIDTADNEIRLNMQRYLAGQMSGDVKGRLRNLHDGAIAHAYIGIQYVQTYCVDIPLWLAAFEGAQRKGLRGDDAVAYADDVLVSSQGAGGAKDTALIEQSIPFVEWLTMFYSYGSTYLNRQVSMGRQLGRSIEGGLPRIAAELPLLSARVVALAILPVIAEEVINIAVGVSKGAGDEDDDGDEDDWNDRAWHFGKRIAAFQFYGLPGFRDYVGAKYGFRLSPVQSIPDAVSKLGRDAEKIMGGEEVEARKVARDAVMATGYLAGLPLAGPWKHVDYLWRVYDEEEQPESVPEFAGAFVVGKRETN